MKLNLPNRLTLLRIVLVPFFMVFILYPIGGTICARAVALILFLATSFTDLLDGKIARKRGLVTAFGKFLDPLADKFMIFAALLCICASDMYLHLRPVMVWVSAIVIFRELAVTSVRLVAGGTDGVVIAASYLGKIKTVTQCVAVCVIILEPMIAELLRANYTLHVFSLIAVLAMTVMTVWSGIDYLRSYWKYINPNL